jgi:hypothetical protein
MTWIHIAGCDLIAFGTGKGDGFCVNGSGMCSDYEGFAGHDGKRASIIFDRNLV